MKRKKSRFKTFLSETSNFIGKTAKAAYKSIKKPVRALCKWIGYDGLMNMETCTVLVCLFGCVITEIPSAIIVLIISVLKSTYDKCYQKHEGELHDFICCIMGIIMGMFLIYML